ncbi:hypothetical protein TRICI_000767 [Trichomonascus ciferrii]|uniref:Uncharacterized protein n=1 Tax=Trichomonascus ciferrii TaxID=44093 RepID=A0A642VCT9_9ASCO|nr:hypothetical protein TRICI_000767 [Trichomonascus ciferrii]
MTFFTFFPESAHALDEQTPLLADSTSPTTTTQINNEQYDQAKREEILNDIVQFTGDNLIDVSSVSQPEIRTIGKSANEYKRVLAELKYAGSTGTSPSSTNASSVNSRTLLPKASASSNLSDSDKKWLNNLADGAVKAIKQEPTVHSVGTLILNFQD